MRSDALARRIRIIEAACEIFRTSTDIVPLETIADKAGVGIATLYRSDSRLRCLHVRQSD